MPNAGERLDNFEEALHVLTQVEHARVAMIAGDSAVLCGSIRELCVRDHGNDERVLERWLSNKGINDFTDWIADSESAIYVAEIEDEVCGVGAIDSNGNVTLNYVAPKYRFKGVSKAMLRELESQLRSSGTTRGRLESTETARRFYLDSGWEDAGEPDVWIGMKGYPMAKNL